MNRFKLKKKKISDSFKLPSFTHTYCIGREKPPRLPLEKGLATQCAVWKQAPTSLRWGNAKRSWFPKSHLSWSSLHQEQQAGWIWSIKSQPFCPDLGHTDKQYSSTCSSTPTPQPFPNLQPYIGHIFAELRYRFYFSLPDSASSSFLL